MKRQEKNTMNPHVTVERVAEDAVRICWDTPEADTSVHIRMADSPEAIALNGTDVAGAVGERCALITGLDPDMRPYFMLIPEGGDGILAAERQVRLEGAVNFRDLGGYETRDGRRIKWGQVFRSDSLARVTERDRVRLSRMGLRLVIDFRTPNEVRKSPDRLPEMPPLRYLNLPITHGEFDFVAAVERIKRGDDSWLKKDFMVSGYLDNVEDFAETWGEVIRQISEPANRPLVFHCTGGKDRAGTCAAILLLALGVPEETVIEDHQLSNVLIAELIGKVYKRIEAYGVDPQRLSPYFTAPRECISALLHHLRDQYGSVSHYLKTRAGLKDETLAVLRQEMLE